MITEEETIFDDKLNDDFLPTASNEGGEGELYEHFRVIVDKGQEPVRIDKFLFERMQHSSRNRIHMDIACIGSLLDTITTGVLHSFKEELINTNRLLTFINNDTEVLIQLSLSPLVRRRVV